MATFRIRVLGGLQAAYDGQPPLVFPQEALALLVAYLVLHPRTHHVTQLAELLYPSLPTAESARHMTGAINRLRAWLTPRGYSTSPFIVQQQQDISWNTSSDYWLDLAAFETTGDPVLYGGELLAGWTAPWIEPLRTRALSRYLELPPAGAYTKPLYLQDQERWPMIGRLPDFRWLTGHVVNSDEAGRMVVLSGEAGVGKSRLLHELAHHTAWRNVRSVSAKCDELATPTPYGVWAQLLRHNLPWTSGLAPGIGISSLVLGDLLRITPDLRASFPGMPPPTAADPATQQTYIARLLAQYFTLAAQRVPHILILDDLQWADAASFEVLNYIVPRLATIPLLIVGSIRSELADLGAAARSWLASLAPSIEQRRLGRLNQAAVAELVTAIGGSADDAHELWAASEGLPLFAIELAGEHDHTTALPTNAPVSERFRHLIEQRYHQLDPTAQAVLAAAAVSSRCDPDLLAAITGQSIEAVRELFGPLTTTGFLRPVDGQYRFAHDKLRETIHASLQPRERQRIHRQAYVALQHLAPTAIEELARHALAMGEPATALPYLIQAGDRAAGIYANSNAVDFYSQALATPNLEPAVRFELLQRREAVLALMGRHNEQATDVVAMLALAPNLGPGPAYADALLRQANLLEQQDRYAAAVDVVRVALEQYRAIADPAREAAGLRRLAQLHFAATEYHQAERVARAALRIERARDDQLAQAATLHILGQASYNLGNFRRAEVLLLRSAALFEQQRDQVMLARVWSSLGVVYLLRGWLQHYHGALQTALQFAAAAGDRVQLSKVQIRLTYAYLCLGMHAAARATGAAGLALAREFEYGSEIVTALMYLALTELDSQHLEDGLAHMQEALALAQGAGNQNTLATAMYNMATAYLAVGRFTEALQLATELEAKDRQSAANWRTAGDLSLLAEAALGAGQLEQAEAASRAAVAVIKEHHREYTHAQEVWMVHSRVLAATGQTAEAAAAREQARTQLLSQAAEITDPALHRSFLEDAPLNRRILADDPPTNASA